MLLKDFKYETKHNKAKLLVNNGVFLSKRREGDQEILLFHLGSFYAEMFFYEEFKEIGYIRCFESTDHLEPYIENIDLSALVQNQVPACYS
jgi:hypothetical protein